MFERILLVAPATDLRDLSTTLTEGLAIGQAFDAGVTVLHLGATVAGDTDSNDPAIAPFVAPVDQYRVRAGTAEPQSSGEPVLLPYPAEQANNIVAEASRQSGLDFDVTVRNHRSDRVAAIIECVREGAIELVVVGSGGTGTFGSRMGKSISEHLMNVLSIPVVTVNLRAGRGIAPEEAAADYPEEIVDATAVSIIVERLPMEAKDDLRADLVGAVLRTEDTDSDGQYPLRVFETTPKTEPNGTTAVRITDRTEIRLNSVDVPLVMAPRSVPVATAVSLVCSNLPAGTRSELEETVVGTVVHTGLTNVRTAHPYRVFGTDPETDESGLEVVRVTPETELRVNVIDGPLVDADEGVVTSASGDVLLPSESSQVRRLPSKDVLVVNAAPVGSSLGFDRAVSERAIEVAAAFGGTVHFLWAGLIGGYRPSGISFVDRSQGDDSSSSAADHLTIAAERFAPRSERAFRPLRRMAKRCGIEPVFEFVTLDATTVDLAVVEYATDNDVDLVFIPSFGEKKGAIRTMLGDSLTERLIKYTSLTVVTLNVRNLADATKSGVPGQAA